MSELKKIYDGWANEKYPQETHNNGYRQKAYTAALEDKLEPVAVAFLKWVTSGTWAIAEGTAFNYNTREKKTNKELFAYFMQHIYQKQ